MRSSNPVLSRPDAFTPQQQPGQGGFQQQPLTVRPFSQPGSTDEATRAAADHDEIERVRCRCQCITSRVPNWNFGNNALDRPPIS